MSASSLARGLSKRTPFFYGWIVLAAVCCAGFARQGAAVATLSIFVSPMTSEFGWSRTAISGAVSLGGILAAILSPLLGPLLDRHGARMMLTLAVLVTGIAVASLALTTSMFYFYVSFCIARTCFAGPFDLGIYGAVNNWFLRHRAIATAVSNVAMMGGLACLPLIAQFFINNSGWREAWLALGATVLIVGLLPVWFLIGRRPEDLGLEVDGGPGEAPRNAQGERYQPKPEPAFSRAEAVRTPAFWLLNLYTLLIFPIQAGISLHQAPLLIERGLDATSAAVVVATFSLCSGISGLAFGVIVRRIGVKFSLLLASFVLIAAVAAMVALANTTDALIAAALFGAALGGMFTTLPVAWADFFGRESYGAIRGIALSIQVVAQASGPLISGVMRDATGNYILSLHCFLGFAVASLAVAMFLRKPG
jgi:OFA family oxalate/formate antiporter-like MFS transporter